MEQYGSNPGGGGEILRTRQTGLGAHPDSYTMGTEAFPGGKVARAWRCPPTHTYRRGDRKSRAIPLLPLWAFVACSRVTFTFMYVKTGSPE
jgi:hypothetical protein